MLNNISFATIHRTCDGLPLVAVNDFDPNTDGLFEAQKCIKLLCKKMVDFPERCTIHADNFYLHWISINGISVIAVCIGQYPPVLAFSFLYEMQREFSSTYGKSYSDTIKRPYSFNDFGTVLERTRHKYNNTRTLSSKISNLAELSQQLKIRPPFQVSEVDLQTQSQKNSFLNLNTARPVVNPNRRLLPINWLDSVAVLLCIVCAVINLTRGMSVINDGHLHTEGNAYIFGATFLCSSLLSLYQVYFIFHFSKWRKRITLVTLIWILLCHFYTRHLRNMYQLSFHLCSACFTTYIILSRTLQDKLPDYNV